MKSKTRRVYKINLKVILFGPDFLTKRWLEFYLLSQRHLAALAGGPKSSHKLVNAFSVSL